MKKKYNKIKNYCNKNKILLLVYFITTCLTIISLVKEIESNHIKNAILCFLSIFLSSFPLFVDKIKKIKIPVILKIVFILFVFSTMVLGEVNDFYGLIPIWDDILHLVQGFFITSIGFSFGYILFKTKNMRYFRKTFIILFSLCLSLSVGVTWEIVEYTVDCNINVDMQKDKYIYNFNSILLNPKKNNEIMMIERIGYTSIYDESGERIVTFNGYLDIGLHDTMDDLIDTLVGSLLFCVIGYLYLTNREKYNWIKIFLIESKDNFKKLK